MVVNYVIWTVAVLVASAPCCQCSQGVGTLCSKLLLTVLQFVLSGDTRSVLLELHNADFAKHMNGQMLRSEQWQITMTETDVINTSFHHLRHLRPIRTQY
jgi:hypothetical protein